MSTDLADMEWVEPLQSHRINLKAIIMKNVFVAVACSLSIAAVGLAQKDAPVGASKTKTAPAQPVAAKPASPAVPEASADEKAVYQTIDAFEKAYNAADAKALAVLFTDDAELVDEDGDVTHGRTAIEVSFAAAFEARPGTKLTIDVGSLRSIGQGLIVEDGSTTVTFGRDEPTERSRYTVIHAKLNGVWRMASAREFTSGTLSNAERLQQLDWLIGEWVDESPVSVVKSTFKWSEDGHFILNEYSAKVAGRPAVSGSQRFGWDPLANQIRTWVFDSKGGYGEGLWSRDGDRWIIKQRNVTSAGQVVTATNVLTRIDKDRWGWQSYDRVVGGELTPEVEQVIVVRTPPEPEAAAGKAR